MVQHSHDSKGLSESGTFPNSHHNIAIWKSTRIQFGGLSLISKIIDFCWQSRKKKGVFCWRNIQLRNASTVAQAKAHSVRCWGVQKQGERGKVWWGFIKCNTEKVTLEIMNR